MFLFQKSSFLSKKSPVILLLEELYLKTYLAKAFFSFFFLFKFCMGFVDCLTPIKSDLTFQNV